LKNKTPAANTLDNQSTPHVTVLVLHWRGIDKTRECLKSLKELDYPHYSILLVDNGSENNDGATLKSEFENLEILRLSTNHGFAGGCNQGIKHQLAKTADKQEESYIWLLNNDATVRPENLKRLTFVLSANTKAGAAAALVLEGKDGEKRAATGVGKIDFAKAKTYLKPVPENAASVTNSVLSCDWVTGSNLLLKESVLREIGLFDERYFLYFEDVDLCLRIRKAGYECLLVADTMIEHEGSASTQGGLSLWRAYYHTRNRLLFFALHAPLYLKPWAFFLISLHVFKHCLTLPGRGPSGKAKLKVELMGYSDYCLRTFGQSKRLDWCENFVFDKPKKTE